MSTPEAQPPERARLRHCMEHRQEQLDEDWKTIAGRSGANRETFRRVRHGSSPLRATTVAALERGLRWERGSIRAILSGGDPTPEPDTPGAPEAEDPDRYATGTVDLGDRVIHLARDLSASARGQGVPAQEAAEMTRRALERALGAAEGTGLLALEHELQKWRRAHDSDTPGE